MLTKLVVKNVRSIVNAEISFEKSGIEYRKNYVYRDNYLNPITFYGDNGSGKSIILSTLFFLTVLMGHDSSELEKVGIFPDVLLLMDNDKLKNISVPIPTMIFSFLTKEGLAFDYAVGAPSANFISSEVLAINGKIALKRSNNKYTVNNIDYTVANNYSAVRKIGIEDYSADSDGVMAQIKKCYEYMKRIIFIDDEVNSVYGNKTLSTSPRDYLIKESVCYYLSKFSSLPKFKMEERQVENGEKTLYMRFEDDISLPFPLTSDGIKRESHILSALEMSCEDDDYIVVADEINKSIHPLNLKRIVDEFIKKDVQLIFSCHDTNLLKHLRPDQIYFAYFGKDYHSTFKRLNEIHPNIREINNIESMYLKGVFDKAIAKS